MQKIIVIGAAGRMGKRLVSNISESEHLTLVGATEYDASPCIGQDAGILAGVAENGVKIVSDLKSIISQADAIIDFSTGDVLKNAQIAVDNDCSVVIGTTALGDAGRNELQKLASQGGRIVFASNMSVGVNLLFHTVSQVAKTLGKEYNVEILEMHHNLKKDAPSGTAVTLAENVAEARGLSYDDCVHGREGIVGERGENEIGMHAIRGGDVVGDHTVIFATNGERFELTHKASSRDAFAKGALKAVLFLENQCNGLYDMQDVLKLK